MDATRTWVGRAGPRFPGVRRIAVLRGGGLGDLVQSLPAAEALAAAYPDAALTLLGLPAHLALLADRPSPYRSLVGLPVRPGVRAGTEDPAATAAFLVRALAERFDLAVQLHGGGRNANPLLLELGARHTLGSRTDDAPELERTRPFLHLQHEVLRGLEVVALAGAAPVGLEPRLHLRPAEQEQRDAARGGPPTVVVHPGATDLRRHWPVERFAAVVGALVADGVRVELVGDASEADLAEALLAAVDAPHGRLASRVGAQDLGALVGTLAAADVVLANDSGPRHVAAAVGTRTAGVFWVGNVVTAAPLGRSRHRIQVGFTPRCPVCDRDLTEPGWTAERCEHDPSIVADVDPVRVLADVRALLADAVRERRGEEDGRRAGQPG
ncbi:MAG: ADP-heptose--lipooligosaccharide heptosyltransferase II [uncultured Friedmanniella sp.]|uniref:ADP-heptose--lipooligosaccharide heptosyltransferase II n=1 Tax=uncultured Friedmanniella sp. TaxID=335381 RepID=A0A6J4KST0_9ACTN|nr:MAG: ADP-heptose--lipooligosaccharide heptosyltransferase II [uncultured Friedmanniella sp.]